MSPYNQRTDNRRLMMGLLLVLTLTALTAGSVAFGHGGKSHGAMTFSPLQALQKATELYDQLVISGKLPEQWETELEKAEIAMRQKAGADEFVVSFHRKTGDPQTVYIFFTAEGQYNGSNFTGE